MEINTHFLYVPLGQLNTIGTAEFKRVKRLRTLFNKGYNGL